MFGKLKLKLAAAAIMSLLKSLAADKNAQTTVTGMLAGAILAIHGLDMAQLLAGDPQQIALVVSGLAVALVGFLATKENHDGHTTLLGVVAAASQAFIGNFTAAITVALCGYFTNKTVVTAAPVRTAPFIPTGIATWNRDAPTAVGSSTYVGPVIVPAKEK
jgi:hypothetical protein